MAACLAFTAFPMAAVAQEVDLDRLSLKRLLDIDVTSVSKRSQRLQDVATSIYVITEEDIHRSGATRIQELLKMAPGGWISDDSYTISAVGVREGAHPFNQTLLWILDGVPIINPISGGVIFDVMDLPLADIQRIEVIKGPGGTIYGANAAAGIISIYTKTGEASDGFHGVLEGGTQGYVAPFFRYGFEPAEDLFVTAWGKVKNHEGYDRNPLFSGDSLLAPVKGGAVFKLANRFPVADDDNQKAVSFGAKWDFQPRGPWRWSGGFSRSDVRSGKYLISHHPWPDSAPADPTAYRHPAATQLPREDRGGQVTAHTRMDYSFREGHNVFLNAYHWRNTFRWMANPALNMDFDISDLEFQDNLEISGWHRVSAGANLRMVHYDFSPLGNGAPPPFADPERRAFLFGAFLQDEMSLGESWRLTLGAKAETWSLIGPYPEISPSLRLAYQAGPDLTFWAAASRSITTPSYAQFDMEYRVQQIPSPWFFQAQGMAVAPPAAGKWAAVVPGGDVHPVDYYTLEAGNRGLLGSRFQWDIAGFYSWTRGQLSITPYDATLQTIIPSTVYPGDSILPLYNANIMDYQSFGGEGLVRLFPNPVVRLELSYSLFWKYNMVGLDIPGDTTGRTLKPEEIEGDQQSTPRHVGRFKAYLDLPWEVDFTFLGVASSPFSRGAKFDYRTMRPDPVEGVEVAEMRPQFQLDAVLQRTFYRDRITATLWGRNLLASEPYTEYYNQYVWSTYPHQVHWTFGGGLEYRF